MKLEGKVALVTGSTGGIGEATAVRLASEGADVVVTGRSRARGEAVARRLKELGSGRSRFIAADLSTPDEPLALAKRAEEWLGAVDILVNNAAIGGAGPSAEVALDDWDTIFAVNVRSPYLISTALMTSMAGRGTGVVVNITSSVAYRGWPGYSAYASSKAALDAMTRCWAATYGPWGVRVNAISPGPVLTPGALRESTAEDIGVFCSRFGVGRSGVPEDIAAAIAFLAGDQADYVHGSTLHVDGGMVETFGYQPIAVRTVALESPSGRPASKRRSIRDRFQWAARRSEEV
jgi:NAD(P)-dependent dehydrogenase (short-subunit alcohol dehydrogenase family)